MKVTLEREATELEIEAIKKVEEVLTEVNLELIGTRPKDR